MEFLEERYPEPPLLPPDPADRGRSGCAIFRDDDFTDPYYALRRGEDGAAEQLDAALARFDALLGEQPYLGGAEYGLADIALVPWVLRARDMLGVDLDGFPASPTGSRGSRSGPRLRPKPVSSPRCEARSSTSGLARGATGRERSRRR